MKHLMILCCLVTLSACATEPQPITYQDYRNRVEIIDKRVYPLTEKESALLRGLCFNGFDQQNDLHSVGKGELIITCWNNTIIIEHGVEP